MLILTSSIGQPLVTRGRELYLIGVEKSERQPRIWQRFGHIKVRMEAVRGPLRIGIAVYFLKDSIIALLSLSYSHKEQDMRALENLGKINSLGGDFKALTVHVDEDADSCSMPITGW